MYFHRDSSWPGAILDRMVDMAVRVASRASASTLSEHEESELMVNPRGLYAGLKAASESFSFWCFCAAVAASELETWAKIVVKGGVWAREGKVDIAGFADARTFAWGRGGSGWMVASLPWLELFGGRITSLCTGFSLG